MLNIIWDSTINSGEGAGQGVGNPGEMGALSLEEGREKRAGGGKPRGAKPRGNRKTFLFFFWGGGGGAGQRQAGRLAFDCEKQPRGQDI